MEFPHLGNHCSVSSCNKLDFLPIRCDACGDIFCNEHYHYTVHDCRNAYQRNNQVPVCPLCNIPIPVNRGEQPDVTVGAHMDNDCQSDPAKQRRKVFTNKCSKKGCKVKEVVAVMCGDCNHNYCFKHRHPIDHDCGKNFDLNHPERHLVRNGIPTWDQNQLSQRIQGTMTEDEALAKALAMSLQDSSKTNSKKTQEELDLALARQLASESQTAANDNHSRNRCNVS